jgi:RNA polymerase sigma-70 factor (ECF subfamily)
LDRIADLAEFAAAAAAGDEQAFRVLYQQVQPGLLRYLTGIVDVDAEDVAAETWLQIARDIRSYREQGGGFRAWAVSIARHRAIDHVRRRRRRPAVLVPTDSFTDRASDDDTGEQAAEALQLREAIALIATLPTDQAEVVLLRVVVGLDVESTAQVLGKRAGAVRTNAHRGLRRLAERLNGDPTAGPALPESRQASRNAARVTQLRPSTPRDIR